MLNVVLVFWLPLALIVSSLIGRTADLMGEVDDNDAPCRVRDVPVSKSVTPLLISVER